MDSFPRQHARTKGFTLGAPRNFAVSDDGRYVTFLRSKSGDDPINCLWLLDTADNHEYLLADPNQILRNPDTEELPAPERARRERAREAAGGIVSYAGTSKLDKIAFCLAGTVYMAEHNNGAQPPTITALRCDTGAFNPRPSPNGKRLAYIAEDSLTVVDISSLATRNNSAERKSSLSGSDAAQQTLLTVKENSPTISWGSAEFIAAEEMGRSQGFWWSQDSSHLLVARVDTTQVPTWYIPYPANPERAPLPVRYPAAGTTNAKVSLAIFGIDGSRVDVNWDNNSYEYLARASWAPRQKPTIAVQTRDQRCLLFLEVNPAAGATQEISLQNDEHWVELVAGTPAWMGEHLITVQDIGTARRLVVDNQAVTPDNLQVRNIVAANAQRVVFTASEDPTQTHVWQLNANHTLEKLTSTPAIHTAVVGAQTTVLTRSATAQQEAATEVLTPTKRFTISSKAATPLVSPKPQFGVVGKRDLQTVVLYPCDDNACSQTTQSGLLPVLLDPYGGPHAQRVLNARAPYLVSQWFANQGFAVVITDGRGTPARGPAWERAVANDLANPVLQDQIDALDALATQHGRLDLNRVAIRGWSFGGYLAALAVLARPDRFMCAIAGAPVTNWLLYDTHYTERYLGHPQQNPAAYSRTNLIELAPTLQRPLLLICGLADDNVFAAHTLQLSKALFEAGRPHQVLPLPDVTHMTPQEQVAENLLSAQRNFLFDSFGIS